MQGWLQKITLRTSSFFTRSRKIGWIDIGVLFSLGGLLYGLVALAQSWKGGHFTEINISLSPLALPKYALYSLVRGICAYILSFTFTIFIGYWAAKDPLAEKILIPVLDLLQSVPCLAFMPGLVLAMINLFPSERMGLEMAALLMIFMSQVWNMTFSFYHSIKTVPHSYRDTAKIYRFNFWQKFKWIELPYSAIALVWNSMMSMAGGWFFLMISETFVLGNFNFQLPGIGSYMSLAVAEGNFKAMIWAIFTMMLMIVLLDQLLWRPIVVWSQKFKGDEGGDSDLMSSWFLDWLKDRSFLKKFQKYWRKKKRKKSLPNTSIPTNALSPKTKRWWPIISVGMILVMFFILGSGGIRLLHLLINISLHEWTNVMTAASLTLGRVLFSTILGTLWTLPVGLAIGLSPRWSKVLEPLVQVTASFPAPMIYPLIILLLGKMGISLGWGSILLMLFATQWYLLFNIIAGAMAIPADLREAARSYRLSTWQTFSSLWLPAVFPFLVTGWITAAGGAWNASVVVEYFYFRGSLLKTQGLGALISDSASQANFPLLAACVVVMSVMVVFFNQTVWKRLYRLAEDRFSLES